MTDQNLHLWLIPLLPLVGAASMAFWAALLKNAGHRDRTALHGSVVWLRGVGVRSFQFSGLDAAAHRTLRRHGSAPAVLRAFRLHLDQLSLIMVLVVTGVGFLIHIYSVGYMAHEGGYYRFFAYLNLFMFFMLTLVLADNYLLMFVGWEGVGLASYLLIGFWFLKDSAADAGKKAFIVNRIGDFGFLIGMFLLIQHFGSLDYDVSLQQSRLSIPHRSRLRDCSPRSASACWWARPASPRRFRCTSGCRTRWKARRRSPR